MSDHAPLNLPPADWANLEIVCSRYLAASQWADNDKGDISQRRDLCQRIITHAHLLPRHP